MEQKVCGVTEHREIPAEYMEQAKQGLRREIEKAIADGAGQLLRMSKLSVRNGLPMSI